MTSHLPGDLEGPSERLNVTKDPKMKLGNWLTSWSSEKPPEVDFLSFHDLVPFIAVNSGGSRSPAFST
jgi:hypothetical protein